MQHFSFLTLDMPLFKPGVDITDLSKKYISILDYKTHIHDDILNFFDLLNLQIILVETFFKGPGSSGHVHVDDAGGDYVKLNWAFGGGESKMCWYSLNHTTNDTVRKTAANTSFTPYPDDQVTEIEKVEIRNPTIVQVGVPHNIIDVTEDRYCVSFVFKDKTTNRRLTMEESRNRFKDFLTV